MVFSAIRHVVLPLALAVATPVLAATPGQLREAGALLTAEEPAKALALLEAAHVPDAAGTQELFMLGVSAKLSGNFTKAERYFRSALVREPRAGRIRLELAETLFRQGKYDASKAELEAVRTLNPPPHVRDNIDRFIAQVEDAKANPHVRSGPQKSWSVDITLGVTNDSNVNGGPTTDEVFLYGLPFRLSEDAQETRDTMVFVSAGVHHQKEIGEGKAWLTHASLSVNRHGDVTAYDTNLFSFSTGLGIRTGERSVLRLPVTYTLRAYTEQDGWYSQSFGFAPQLQYAVRNDLQLAVAGQLSRKWYNGNPDRDLTAFSINPSLQFQPHENGNIGIGIYLGRENAGVDIYSNSVRGVTLGYQHLFRDIGLRAAINASYTDTRFDAAQPVFGVAREDISKRVGLSLAYDLPKLDGLSLQGGLTYTENASNIDLNTYTRTQATISLSKRF